MIKDAASKQNLEVSINFTLNETVIRYLIDELGFSVIGNGKSFWFEQGKKIFHYIKW